MWNQSPFVAFLSTLTPSLIVDVRGFPVARICQQITHCGVVLFAVPGVQLTPVAIDCPMTYVEVVAARVTAGSLRQSPSSSSSIGPATPPNQTFLDKMSHRSSSQMQPTRDRSPWPVYVTGDFNVRFDRMPAIFWIWLGVSRFQVCPTDSTHQLGGTIDAVFSRQDLPITRV